MGCASSAEAKAEDGVAQMSLSGDGKAALSFEKMANPKDIREVYDIGRTLGTGGCVEQQSQ
jgi:hypothetical protein